MEMAGNRDLLCCHKRLGGVGLETEYTPYDPDRRSILQKACDEYGFIPTAGSDRHDTSRPFIRGCGENFLRLQQRQLELHGTLHTGSEEPDPQFVAELTEALCPPSLRSE